MGASESSAEPISGNPRQHPSLEIPKTFRRGARSSIETASHQACMRISTPSTSRFVLHLEVTIGAVRKPRMHSYLHRFPACRANRAHSPRDDSSDGARTGISSTDFAGRSVTLPDSQSTISDASRRRPGPLRPPIVRSGTLSIGPLRSSSRRNLLDVADSFSIAKRRFVSVSPTGGISWPCFRGDDIKDRPGFRRRVFSTGTNIAAPAMRNFKNRKLSDLREHDRIEYAPSPHSRARPVESASDKLPTRPQESRRRLERTERVSRRIRFRGRGRSRQTSMTYLPP